MIRVLSMKGEQVMQGSFQGQTPVELEVGMLAKGIYLVQIQAREGVESKKLVIQ